MSAPVITFDGMTCTVILFRTTSAGDLKQEKWTFDEHSLKVCSSTEDELNSWERRAIKGPVATDGLLYYICARPYDIGNASFIWLESKEEAIAAAKALKMAEAQALYAAVEEAKPCSFCGKSRSHCGEDHGDEMRDLQRAAFQRD